MVRAMEFSTNTNGVAKPKMNDFDKRRKDVLKEKEHLDEILSDLEVQEKEAADEKLNNERARKADLILQAQEFEELARESGAAKEDVDARLKWAKQARKEADAIIIPEDILASLAPEPEEKLALSERFLGWLSAHGMSWLFQIIVFGLIAWFCYGKTVGMMHEIQQYNTEMNALGKVTEMLAPPVDDKDIQQMFFDKLQLITDVGFGWLILLLMAPHVLISIIPFISEPKKLWKPFFALPERDKQWLAFAWSALVLLVTIYSHPHK